MRFLRIDPTAFTVSMVEVEGNDPKAANPELFDRGVDHGTLFIDGYGTDRGDGAGIFVYEYGLMTGSGPYFAIDDQLYAGDAVVYRFNGHGETVDIGDWRPEVHWLPTRAAVEQAIADGAVERPIAAINGVVTWRWSGG